MDCDTRVGSGVGQWAGEGEEAERMPDDGAWPGEKREGRTASCSVGPRRSCGSPGEAREVVAREPTGCERCARPGDWKGREKDLWQPSAMFQPVIAQVRVPKEVQVRDQSAESRDGATGRMIGGQTAEPRPSYARVRMSSSRASWTSWAASKPVVARAASWSRASKVVAGLRKPLASGKLRNRS